MKDYTSLIEQSLFNRMTSSLVETNGILTEPIRFTMNKSGDSKLALKKFTGLQLRDAKVLVDEVCHQPISFTIRPSIEQLNIFKEDILLCKNIDYRLDDISKARARKLIQLGMGMPAYSDQNRIS